jgi:XPB/Ssl2-like helicase family protein/WYL domain-containing protein
MTTAGPGPPRTLADDLRLRSDGELEAVFRNRPDLFNPVPADMTGLVARATTRLSVIRALDRLDRFTMQVLDALAHLGDPAEFATLNKLVPAPPEALSAALNTLRENAFAWGPDDAVHLVRAVRDAIGPTSAGTGPPLTVALASAPPARLQQLLADLGEPSTADPPSAITRLREILGDPDSLRLVLAAAPPAAVELLAKVDAGGSGRVGRADRDVRHDEVTSPLEWLLARGLLIAVDAETVVLPAEVAVARRGGALYPEPHVQPPAPTVVKVGAAEVDRAGVAQVMATVRLVEELLDGWALEPPPVLRSGGGLGVRDLRRAEVTLQLDAAHAALIVEIAYATGLVAADDRGGGYWLPTRIYDRWLGLDPSARWTALAEAWLATSRVAALVATRSDVGTARDRPLAALGADLDRAWAPGLRRATLAELAALPAGSTTSAADLLARLAWRTPRRTGPGHESFVRATLAEAGRLGVTGRDALTSYAKPLLDAAPEAAAAKLERVLPAPVEHILIQADLTAVAPGPLRKELAAELGQAADVESTGAATVYRFSAGSVRRALDAGRSAVELHDFLARVSRTPVPQPLTYLVDDVARRHGRIRVGAAASYLRCDDENLIAELLAAKGTARLGLRRLAPTVATALVSPESLLARLRELGYAPTAESATGAVLAARPDARRSPVRTPPRPVSVGPSVTPELATAAVRALRAGDAAAAAGRRAGADGSRTEFDGPPGYRRTSLSTTLERLQVAAAGGASVWMDYISDDGSATERIVDPLGVDGGILRAFDHRNNKVRSFKVSRIRAVAEA